MGGSEWILSVIIEEGVSAVGVVVQGGTGVKKPVKSNLERRRRKVKL